jgi:hypothetical protein
MILVGDSPRQYHHTRTKTLPHFYLELSTAVQKRRRGCRLILVSYLDFLLKILMVSAFYYSFEIKGFAR